MAKIVLELNSLQAKCLRSCIENRLDFMAHYYSDIEAHKEKVEVLNEILSKLN